MPSLHILFASTSGHTEYVIDTLMAFLKDAKPDLAVEKQSADQAKPEDLLRGDFLLLASGTWNTGGSEGQLNPHMHVYLKETAKEIDLAGKKCFLIALGDERYHYTARAGEHLAQFIQEHKGQLVDRFVLVNEPYGQEKKIGQFGSTFLEYLAKNYESRIMNNGKP